MADIPEIQGHHNIVIQNVTGSRLTLNINGEVREIQNQLDELKALLKEYKTQIFQFAEKIYNIGHIDNAIFNHILQQPKDTSYLFNLPPSPLYHIPRQIFKYQAENSHPSSFFEHRESFDLQQELEKHSHIVLLGEAGMGKSWELKWLCHKLKDEGHYTPVYRELKYPNYPTILDLFNGQLDGNHVIVLDGLDEANMREAKLAIEDFRNHNPEVKILVSCRKNVYNKTLEGFYAYELGNLSDADIEKYAQEKLGGLGASSLGSWRNNKLIDNPFFLERICAYVEKNNNKLPESIGAVFDYLIEEALNLRLRLISRLDDDGLRVVCRKSLEKLAFIIECRGENVVSEEDFSKLIQDSQTREVILAKSSLIEYDNGYWRFSHNNFQEYLAAKVLSKAKSLKEIQKIVGVRPDYRRLQGSWINTLSFLFGIYEEKSRLKQELIDWLIKEDIDSLIMASSAKKGRFPSEVRSQILFAAFEKHKREDLSFWSSKYDFWELAEFGESPQTIRYLAKELRNATTPTVKNNALLLLKSMNGYSIPLETSAGLRQTLFSNIFAVESNIPEIRHFALLALVKLFNDLTKEEGHKIVEKFFDSEEAYDRTSAYSVISKLGLQKEYMEQLIRRSLDLDDVRKDDIRLADEDWQLEECFRTLDEEGIVSFFEKYPVVVEDNWSLTIHSLNDILKKLATAELPEEAITRVFEAMKERFGYWLSFPSGADRNLIRQFLENNDLTFRFFQFCLEFQDFKRLSVQYLNEQGIDYLASGFREGAFERPWIDHYLQWVGQTQAELAERVVEKLNRCSTETFVVPASPPKLDLAKSEKDRLLTEKALYFDKKAFISSLEEIFTTCGKEKFNKGEAFKILMEKEGTDPSVFDRYPKSLIRLIDDNPQKSKEELIGRIEDDWQWISINYIRRYLMGNQQNLGESYDLDLMPEELKAIRTWCDNHQPKLNLKKQITKGDIAFTWFVIHFGFKDYPEQVYLDMLNSDLQNHINSNITQFVFEHNVLPLQTIKDHILKALDEGTAEGYRAYNYLKFIEAQKIQEAIPLLPRYIEKRSERFDYRGEALRIYIELGGDTGYLHKLFEELPPEQDGSREEILLRHFSQHPDNEFERILLGKLASPADLKDKFVYAHHLVQLSNMQGLRFFIDYIEKEKKSPFSDYFTHQSFKFEKPEGIPFLLRFFDYGNDPAIAQDHTNRIASVGWSMLAHLAACQKGRYFPKVHKALRRRINWHSRGQYLPSFLHKWLRISTPETLKDMRYLLKQLESQHYQKQEVTLEEAIEKYKGLS
ncbi:MAG: hypothetical protein WA004_08515 [Saprospiraceae bacterium]